MIEFAMSSPNWSQRTHRSYEIERMVCELLGFNPSWTNWIGTDGIDVFFKEMVDVFQRAASQWFSLPRVLSGFTNFAQQPAAACLALESVSWIAPVVRQYKDYDWRHGVEENLISFLGACWSRRAEEIRHNTGLRTAFFEIVTLLASRGEHAALALQDRVNR